MTRIVFVYQIEVYSGMAITLMAYAINAMTHAKPASALAPTNVYNVEMQTPSHIHLGNVNDLQDIITPVLQLFPVLHDTRLARLARPLDQILERSATLHISDNPLLTRLTDCPHALMAMVVTSHAKIVSSVMPHAQPVTEELALIDLHVLILVSLSMLRVDAKFVTQDTIGMVRIKHVRFVTQTVQLEMLLLHVSHDRTQEPTFFHLEAV